MPLCVMPFLRHASLCYTFLRDTYMIVAFLVVLPFNVVFFTSFDSVYFKFD